MDAYSVISNNAACLKAVSIRLIPPSMFATDFLSFLLLSSNCQYGRRKFCLWAVCDCATQLANNITGQKRKLEEDFILSATSHRP
jgi:hypothetical protein